MNLALLVTPVFSFAVLLDRFQKNDALQLGPRGQPIEEKLWMGLDVDVPDSDKTISEFIGDAIEEDTSEMGRKSTVKNYLLLGPFDSGTNLIEAILRSNFGSQIYHVPVWKHSLGLERIYGLVNETVGGNALTDVAVIIMVRSPLAQVSSWHEAPYDLVRCMSRDWFDSGRPCRAALRPRTEDQCPLCAGEEYPSTMGIYNLYMQQYRHLERDGRFTKVLMLPYEDVLYSPNQTVAKLADVLGFAVPKKVTIVDKPAKDHGHVLGRDAAVMKLRSRPWLREIDPVSINILCNDLDRTAVEGLVEVSVGSDAAYLSRPYAQDCLGRLQGDWMAKNSTVDLTMSGPRGMAMVHLDAVGGVQEVRRCRVSGPPDQHCFTIFLPGPGSLPKFGHTNMLSEQQASIVKCMKDDAEQILKVQEEADIAHHSGVEGKVGVEETLRNLRERFSELPPSKFALEEAVKQKERKQQEQAQKQLDSEIQQLRADQDGQLSFEELLSQFKLEDKQRQH